MPEVPSPATSANAPAAPPSIRPVCRAAADLYARVVSARPEPLVHFLVVDDHPLYRDALSGTLRLAFPDAHITEASSIVAAQSAITSRDAADLILLDLSMQGVSGFDGLMSMRKCFPSVPILVVSGLEDPRIVEDCKRYGAAGFVPKSVDRARLMTAIQTVLGGSLAFPRATPGARRPEAASSIAERIAQLTPQQFRVLLMIRQGKLNKQIAHELTVGDSTVKAHVTEILRKLGVASRTQIVIETAALNFERGAQGQA